MLTQLSKIGILDTVTTDSVVLSNILEGVDGSASFGYAIEPIEVKIEDAQTVTYGQNHTFDIRVLSGNSSEQTILDAISQNERPVKLTAIGVSGFFVIDKNSLLAYSRQFDGVIADRCLVTSETAQGYAGTAPAQKKDFYAGDNLLAVYNLLAGSADLMNGMENEGNITASFSAGTQSLTRVSGTTFLKSTALFFPFGLVDLTISMFVNSANATYTYGFRCLDASGATLSDVTTTSTSTTSRVSFTGTTVAGTKFVQFIARAGGTASNTLVFNRPQIALNGKNSFDL